MTQEQKEHYYKQAVDELAGMQNMIGEELQEIPRRLTRLKEMRDGSSETVDSEMTFQTLAKANRQHYDQLQDSMPSPYFNKLVMQFKNEDEPREIYLGKYSFLNGNVYSWTAPIAAIRFNEPGDFSFLMDGQKQQGKIFTKDQFLIVDGEIKFLATESISQERELVYQEYFSQHKTDFVLPEIVAQMEKTQDEVIRAKIDGPLVISGPAGSGKTTLALHRIAYLLQSPETADDYQQNKIIVFVQDASTQNYFSGLLPSFGIHDVEITTFGQWALDILELNDHAYSNIFLKVGDCANQYESAKISALRSSNMPAFTGDVFLALKSFYHKFFTKDQFEIFERQKKTKTFDRIDLSLLLMSKFGDTSIIVNREYYQVAADHGLTRKYKRVFADYSLVAVDEFENYLPEQIDLIKRSLNAKRSSILYVGDLRQQIYLGSVKKWGDLGSEFIECDQAESVGSKRIIRLQKVYRNTKNILNYIGSLGYDIEVPKALREGLPVEEVSGLSQNEELAWVKEKISTLSDVSIGILSVDNARLEFYTKEFSGLGNVRVMPIQEAQGVEFDAVFLLGLDKGTLIEPDFPDDADGFKRELWRINRDLQYIALTRAMNSLYISVR